MYRKPTPIRFFSYAQYKKCFEFARKAQQSFCNIFQTSAGEDYLTKYAQKICVKE